MVRIARNAAPSGVTVEGATAQRGAPLIYDDDKLANGAKSVKVRLGSVPVSAAAGTSGSIVRHLRFRSHMPSGLIEDEHRIRTVVDAPADLGEVLPHRLGIAIGQDKARALSLLGQMAPLVEPVEKFYNSFASCCESSKARQAFPAKALTLLHRKLPPPREECAKPLQLLTPMAACRSVRR